MESLLPRQQRGIIRQKGKIFGRSRSGAPLEVFGADTLSSDCCLVLAGQHGTEVEGTVLLSSALRSIPENSLKCPVVTALNPDGLARGTRCNAAGVDLNRNFPSGNWSKDAVCYSWNNENPQDTQLSPGEYPVSEPETVSILELIDDIQPEIIISIHTPMGCIDDPGESKLSKWISGECGLPLVKDIGYPTPGSFGSWAGEKNISLITFELPFDSIQNIRRKFTPVLINILTGEYRRFL